MRDHYRLVEKRFLCLFLSGKHRITRIVLKRKRVIPRNKTNSFPGDVYELRLALHIRFYDLFRFKYFSTVCRIRISPVRFLQARTCVRFLTISPGFVHLGRMAFAPLPPPSSLLTRFLINRKNCRALKYSWWNSSRLWCIIIFYWSQDLDGWY